jgi:pimeloyl-ACP methyl ester carboxylesterase
MHANRLAVTASICALLAACTGGGSSEDPVPRFVAAACPRDVQILLLVPHSCGYLTVAEDRRRPDGRTVKLFLVKIPPPDEHPRPDPVLILGTDVGALPDYGFHQAEAARLHRVVYILDQRGSGHSRPELSCPEVDHVSDEAVAEPLGDSALRRAVLDAATACRSRLRSAGIDPSDYDLAAMADDVEDLRRALGVSSWNLAAYGSLSRLALEVIRTHPRHVRAAYLDSPEFPQLDEPATVSQGTALMLSALFRSCRRDPSCRTTYPDLRWRWSSAIAELAADPVEAGSGTDQVVIDAASFVRGTEAILSEDAGELLRFPALVAGALDRRVGIDLTTGLRTHGALCVGYRFKCSSRFSTGVYLTVLCRDEEPSTYELPPGSLTPLPGLREAFEANPYEAACSAWDVRPSAPAIRTSVDSSVPILLLSGQFDPFSPPRLTRALGETLRNSVIIEVPGWTHLPLETSGCQIRIRDAWMEDPSTSAIKTACLRRQRLEFLPRRN